jgi:hypothetical protein
MHRGVGRLPMGKNSPPAEKWGVCIGAIPPSQGRIREEMPHFPRDFTMRAVIWQAHEQPTLRCPAT